MARGMPLQGKGARPGLTLSEAAQAADRCNKAARLSKLRTRVGASSRIVVPFSVSREELLYKAQS